MPTMLQNTLNRLRESNPKLFVNAQKGRNETLQLYDLLKLVSYPTHKTYHLWPEVYQSHVRSGNLMVAASHANADAVADIELWVKSRAYDHPDCVWPPEKAAPEFEEELPVPISPEEEVLLEISDLVEQPVAWGTW